MLVAIDRPQNLITPGSLSHMYSMNKGQKWKKRKKFRLPRMSDSVQWVLADIVRQAEITDLQHVASGHHDISSSNVSAWQIWRNDARQERIRKAVKDGNWKILIKEQGKTEDTLPVEIHNKKDDCSKCQRRAERIIMFKKCRVSIKSGGCGTHRNKTCM